MRKMRQSVLVLTPKYAEYYNYYYAKGLHGGSKATIANLAFGVEIGGDCAGEPFQFPSLIIAPLVWQFSVALKTIVLTR